MPNHSLREALNQSIFTISQKEKDIIVLSIVDNISVDKLVKYWVVTIDNIFQQSDVTKGVYLDNSNQHWTSLIASVPSLSLFLNAILYREQFYQLPLNWHKHLPSTDYPQYLIQSSKQFRRHPQRPPKPVNTVYSRYDHSVEKTISFRLFDLSKDIDHFVRWMNDPRVAEFWEQAWSKEKLVAFIKERLADPHIIPLIGEFDGESFGYFEVYWVSEDRLAPYYDNQVYDRGIHLLVGEQLFRGPLFFKSWMRALTHYIFIDDQRTQRVVLEPRNDNQRLFRRIKETGYQKLFEFDFPHKTSALMMTERMAFFAQQFNDVSGEGLK